MDTTASTPIPLSPTTEAIVDYGDQIPLNFMDVNYDFAIVIIVTLAVAAAIGTFGNILILVAVATQRQLRSVESIFVVSLACCDLYVTMFAEPLSIVAKTVGWRSFEGVPGVCRVIGYLCTMSCVGSLMSLSIMSLNRYVLICHHTLYHAIFTTKKCLFYCFCIYLFGFFLISFNFFGIGDHSFDYKSYECVWDRMASHDYTIVFSIVLVWVPMTITGLAYGRTYWYVHKVRKTVAKSAGVKRAAPSPGSNSVVTKDSTSTRMAEGGEGPAPEKRGIVNVSVVGMDNDEAGSDDDETTNGTANAGQERDPSLRRNDGQLNNSGENNSLKVPPYSRPARSSVRFPASADNQKEEEASPPQQSSGSSHPGLKLARPLFIIYVVFSTCWMPYSLVVIFDRYNTFPHELHAFITAFAHLNSSINWLVYYHTHNKMRRAFRGLLGCNTRRISSVEPATTVMTLKSGL